MARVGEDEGEDAQADQVPRLWAVGDMGETMKDRIAVVVIRWLARMQAWVHWFAFREPVWVSTDGTPHRYGDLTDRHLRNILKLMERKGEDDSAVYDRLTDEETRRRSTRG